jgi:hypothetical protein
LNHEGSDEGKDLKFHVDVKGKEEEKRLKVWWKQKYLWIFWKKKKIDRVESAGETRYLVVFDQSSWA